MPPHNGVMGALGMALLARERVHAHRRAHDASAAGTSSRSTTPSSTSSARRCSNECDVRQFTIEGEKTYWGDKCSDRYRKPAKVDKEPVIADLVAFREEQLLAPYEAAARACRESAPTVGFAARHVHLRPAAVLGHVLRRAGPAPGALAGERQADPRGRRGAHRRRAVLPHPRGARPRAVAVRRRASTGSSCPTRSTKRPSSMQYNSHACPWGQTLPFVVTHGARPRGAPRQVPRRRACASATAARGWCATSPTWCRRSALSKARVRSALDAAYEAQDEFRDKLLARRRARRSSASSWPASSASSSSAARTTCTTRASTWTSRASCASSTG